MTGLLWDMSVLDPRLVEQIAEELLTEPGLIEKDWYLVRAIGAKGNENRFFSADCLYPGVFDAAAGLRPFLRVEMTLSPPSLPPITRPIRSLIATVQGQPAEVAAFPCVDPAETAADKLSALVWRVLARKRGCEDDDPSIIRHLHDLAALEASRAFRGLAAKAMAGDVGRGGITETDPNARLAAVLDRLGTDRLWAEEYEDYVRQVSYADPAERIGFTTALAALQALAASVTPAS